MRDSFIFYRSFLKSIQHLDTSEQLELFHAIVEYGLNHQEPEMSRYVRAVWESIKPQLDANQRKYENGCKGGKPKANQNLTKLNQDLTTPEPPPNLMYNGNDNGNDKENEKEEGVMKKPKRDCSVLFDQFWALYPRKTSKQSASKAFAKLKDEDQQKAISNIARLYADTPLQYIPHAATYINQARWEDEVIPRDSKFTLTTKPTTDEPDSLPHYR